MSRGDFVRIASGPFAGMTGTVADDYGDYLAIRLTSTGWTRIFERGVVRLESRATSPTRTENAG